MAAATRGQRVGRQRPDGPQGHQPRDRDRPEDEQTRGEVGAAERQGLQQAQQGLRRRGVRGRAEGPDVVPAGGVVLEEDAGAGRERRQLPAPQRARRQQRDGDDQAEHQQGRGGPAHRVAAQPGHDPGRGRARLVAELGRGVHPQVPAREAVDDGLAVRAGPRADAAEAVPQLAVGPPPHPLDVPTELECATQVHQVPRPGADGLPRVADLAGGQEPDDLGQPHREEQRHDQQQPQGAVVLQQAGQRVAFGEVARTEQRGLAKAVVAGGRAHVAPRRGGHDLDLPAGQPGSPAQVEVVAEDVVAAVEAPHRLEHVPPHEHPGGRDHQRAAGLVALALVALVGFEPEVRPAGDVDGPAHLLQAFRVVPVHQLRTHDGEPGVAGQGLDEVLDGVGAQREVVVDEQDEVTGGVGVQGHADGAREPEVAFGDQHAVLRQAREQRLARVVLRAVVDRDDVEVRVGLLLQRLEDVGQPRPTVRGDEDGQHRGTGRCHGGVRPPGEVGGGHPVHSSRQGRTRVLAGAAGKGARPTSADASRAGSISPRRGGNLPQPPNRSPPAHAAPPASRWERPQADRRRRRRRSRSLMPPQIPKRSSFSSA